MTDEARTIEELVDQELTGIEDQLAIMNKSQSLALFAVHLEIQSRIKALRMFSSALGKEILKPHGKTVAQLHDLFDRMRQGEHVSDQEIAQMINQLRAMVDRVRQDALSR